MNPVPETRQSLLLRLRDPSDQQAWNDFVELYQPVVYRVAFQKGLQDADALDLVQTVFVAIAGSIEHWTPKNDQVKFRHWLLRIAKNATLNALTRRPLEQARKVGDNQAMLEQLTENNRYTESLIDLEYRRQLFIRASAMVRNDVNEDSWKAFELTAIDGLSKEAAASELGKSIGVIYAARSRIMKRLCDAVAMLEGEGK